MKKKKYILLFSIALAAVALSCSIDESKFPLPYNSRTTGAYLRIYRVSSNILDLNDLPNSGFEAIFEPVDEKNGDNLASIEFYVSFRNALGLSREVLVKTVDASVFSAVPAPTYSVYKRARIRVSGVEMQTALFNGLNTLGDPDGPGPINGATPASGLVAYTGLAAPALPGWIAGNALVLRWTQVLTNAGLTVNCGLFTVHC